MKIRAAVEADYEQLVKLYNFFAQKDLYSEKNNDSFAKVMKDSKAFMYVVEEKKDLIGFITLSIRYVVRYPQKIATVDELFVLGKYRKQGIGKKLMKTVENKAKLLNCQNIYVESRMDLSEAHNFYEVLEYKKDGYYFKKKL